MFHIVKILLISLIISIPLFYDTRLCFSEGLIRIAHKNNAYAIIVTDGSSKETASILSKYLNITTGAKFPVENTTIGTTPVTIYIKQNKATPITNHLDFAKLHSYSIEFPDERTIIISGNSSLSVKFGVYDFLERYLGVRWLFPGRLGEHLPFNETVDIPAKNVYEIPEFFSRQLSGLSSEEEITWANRNRMHMSIIKFHHNLHTVLPPEKFSFSNPEFYPVINGKRFIPGQGARSKWQPCFSNKGSVQEVAKVINDYFLHNPGSISFSLGVNDGGGFCECSTCKNLIGKKVNFLGNPDHSELYYYWINSIVEEVLKVYPDKWFGCLAYSSVASPPSFPLHPRIIPFLTSDRLKWLDINMESKEKMINERWKNKAAVLGWYDYIYGKHYILPRIYFHKMSDYLNYASNHNVKFIYSEAYPNWGEGPKLYLALRLQWNPGIDVDSALNDWYVAAVGEDAAKYLSNYFQFWEKFWVERVSTSPWFKTRGHYLNFKSLTYSRIPQSKDFSWCRQQLILTKRHAKTELQKERADFFLNSLDNFQNSIIQSSSLKSYTNILMRTITEHVVRSKNYDPWLHHMQ